MAHSAAATFCPAPASAPSLQRTRLPATPKGMAFYGMRTSVSGIPRSIFGRGAPVSLMTARVDGIRVPTPSMRTSVFAMGTRVSHTRDPVARMRVRVEATGTSFALTDVPFDSTETRERVMGMPMTLARARVSENDARVSENDARVSENDARVSENDARVSENDARVSENDARVSENDARVSEKDTRVRGTGSRVAFARARIDAKTGPLRAKPTPLPLMDVRLRRRDAGLRPTGRRHHVVDPPFERADGPVPLLTSRFRSTRTGFGGPRYLIATMSVDTAGIPPPMSIALETRCNVSPWTQ